MIRNTILVTFLTLLVSFSGFFAQILIAKHFGIGVEVDALIFTTSLPTFVSGLVATILSYSVVPKIVALSNDKNYHDRYVLTLGVGVTFFAILISSIGIIIGFIQVKSLPNDSYIKKLPDFELMIFLSWLIGFCQIILSCFISIINSKRFYIFGVLITLIPNLGSITVLLFFESLTSVHWVLVGTMSGTVLAILISFLILKEHFQFISFSLLLWDEIYNLFKTCIYTALAMICFSSYSVIDSYWAPRAGHSTLSILGYSQRILIGIGNLVVVGPSTVFVHDFALLLRDRDFRNFWQLFLKLTVSAFVVSVFVAATTAQFAEHIVYHLFSRGNFGEYEVMAVSNCLKYFAPGMAMMLLSVIILRVLFCFDGLAKNLGILGIFWTISYIIFSKYLHTLGANGIALSYSISWIIYLLFITFLIVNIYYKKIKPNL